MQKRLLLLCFCIGTYLYTIAQPANNDCAGAIAITVLDGTCTTGIDITGATEDIAASGCTVGANENVWFSFVADGPSAQINVSTALGTPEITIFNFPTTPCNSSNVVEIDCSTGSPLTVDNLLVDGQTYYVMVAFSNNPDGLFDICIDNPDPAPNDACSTAQPIANVDDACATYSNDFPSTDVLIPSCFTGATYNVWFSFVAAGVSLDLHIPSGPGVAQFAVVDFTGANCQSTGAVVLGCETGTNHIVLDNQLTIGTTYHILVGFPNTTFNGAGLGNFELCIDNPVPAENDDCDDAIDIPNNVLSDPDMCFTSIAGNALNNDWPSTDLLTFGCWDPAFSYNIWYSFVAQGNDVLIEVDPEFNADAQIALVQFTGTPCQQAGAFLLECANGTLLDYNDDLIIGNTYYVVIGFENNAVGDFCMNVFNPVPPPNDDPCNAIVLPTNGNCVDGTTVYANPENLGIPSICQNAISNTVWYTITMADPDNVGYEIDLDLEDVNPGTTVSVILWEAANCASIVSPSFFYCGDPPTEPIEFGPVDETATYYVMVGTSEPNETDFEICVDEIPPCFTNDICTEATPILNVVSDAAFVCVDGCNLYADPEGVNNACGIGDFSTVWFQVQTDGNATLMNVQVSSEEFDAPTITVFHALPDCNNLVQIPLTQSNIPCATGSNGVAQALATDVGSSEIYYIAVSSLNSVGGNFELCVNTISVASACVLSREIEITSRSGGGPLTGPFFPGETIGVCMNVNSYTPVGNGCQWFQGLVPVFGNGWDPSSFDANGQPIGATVNGNAIGAPGNGLYGGSTWDWFDGVGYHHTNVYFQVGDIDGNGTVDMCNILYDPSCPDFGGITGGCCGPCWANSGDPLPPGWFAYGINGSCGTPGPPVSVDWGDGNSCGSSMGPWEFCFDLIVRDYPDCLDDATTMDLSLGFFTFADGETGAWTGGASICALDQPAKITLPMCCTELEEDSEELDPICSGNVIVYVIDKPGVDFWQWTATSSTVTGATSGQGGPGSVIINTLVNGGSDPEIVEYTFLGFAGGACPVFEHTVTVEVFPQIMATLDPLVLCATPTNPYTITPTVTGGSPPYDYQWAPNGENTPSITVANPVNGTNYVVSITDNVGCFGTANVVISVYETFPVDIIAPITEQCIQNGPIELSATATGGLGGYEFLWTFPGGTNEMGDEIETDETGEHLVEVTDGEGCIGKDSVDILFNETPEVIIDAVNGALAICEGESTTLNGIASMGESPYIYSWDTPEGPDDGTTILAFEPGIYTVTVEDANGCTNTSEVEILAQPQPNPSLGPDIYACPDFSDAIELTVDPEFEDYQWSIGAAGDGLQTIGVYNPGIYSVTVTNDAGCTGETEVAILLFPSPAFVMPDTFEICPGASLTLDSDDYGGPWDITQWSECGSCFNLITISTTPSDHEVTVYDDNGCTAEQAFTVQPTSQLSANLTGDDVICTGETITLTAAPGFSSYTWLPNPTGSTTNTLNVTSPGTYNLTVTDNSGCTGTDMIVITSGDITTSITGVLSICEGVQTTLDAGGGFAQYLWNNNATTQTITVEEGPWSVTVTSSNGCTATASTTVVETPFQPIITGDPIICQTSESTTLDAGGPYASYLWSPGNQTTQTINVSTAGTYTVVITDLLGCVGSASYEVTNHPVPFVAVTGNPDFCVGGNTQLSATSGYVSYNWNPPASTETITVNAAGLYTVTITDANGCTNTSSMTVNTPYQETVEIQGSFVFCPGDQATLAVPSGYTSVLWSTGETTDTIYVTTEGTITVNVVDSQGCIASDDVVTDENSTLSPVITGATEICDNSTTTLNAGPGFDNYLWSTSETTPSIDVNGAGTYSVTVSSNSGCSGTDDIAVVNYNSPYANVTPDATACSVQEPGGPTTVINFNNLVTGGDTGGSWIQISGPSSVNLGNLNNVDFNGLADGTYTFTYTTNSATPPCQEASYTVTVDITDCACPVVALGLAPDLCNDLGSIDLNTLLLPQTEPGGTWSIGSAPAGSNPGVIIGDDFVAGTADPGNYTLVYTVSGLPSYCVNTASTVIEVLRTPVAGTADEPPVFCKGENQVVNLFSLVIGGDTGGFWIETSATPSTGGAFNPTTGRFDVVNQQAGSYSFEYIVEGDGPCPDDRVTVEVFIENNPVADAGATATLDCTQSTTTLGGPGTSVGSEFVYSWTTPDGNISGATDILNPTATSEGTYILTVMNINTGCSATDEVTIDQIGDFPTKMDLFVQSPDCEGDPPGNAQVSAVTGGIQPYTYYLNGDGPRTSPVFSNLSAGDYEVLVVDATGCELRDSFTIDELVEVDLSIVNFVNDTFIFLLGDTIRLTYLYSGSSSVPDSLVWKSGDSVLCTNCTFLELEAFLAGEITLEAYDIRGCFISRSINYLVVRNREYWIPNVFSPNEDGKNDIFTIYTKSDLMVSKMEVFTRWGDLVFQNLEFQPNDESEGWDGKFRGEYLNPGVYVYRMEVVYGDGLKEQFAGDITIIR